MATSAQAFGVVELTIALHYVFNTPEDRLVWDVGHQTPAKSSPVAARLAAGIRQAGGIAGFPSAAKALRHLRRRPSSTSISAALGHGLPGAATRPGAQNCGGDWRWRHDRRYRLRSPHPRRHAMADMLVVLDNNMSISPMWGDWPIIFAHLGKALHLLPPGQQNCSCACRKRPNLCKTEEHMKGMVSPAPCLKSWVFITSAPSTATT